MGVLKWHRKGKRVTFFSPYVSKGNNQSYVVIIIVVL